jgi:hypothetical protein
VKITLKVEVKLPKDAVNRNNIKLTVRRFLRCLCWRSAPEGVAFEMSVPDEDGVTIKTVKSSRTLV